MQRITNNDIILSPKLWFPCSGFSCFVGVETGLEITRLLFKPQLYPEIFDVYLLIKKCSRMHLSKVYNTSCRNLLYFLKIRNTSSWCKFSQRKVIWNLNHPKSQNPKKDCSWYLYRPQSMWSICLCVWDCVGYCAEHRKLLVNGQDFPC